jgi:GTP-binding protein Era
MNKSLNKSVNQALKDVDLILFLSEPNKLDAIDKKILQMIPGSTPILLIINKIDLIKDKSKILALMSEADQLDKFEEIVPTSVKKKNNLLELLKSVKKYLPQQPFIYDQGELTDKGERFLAGEIVREKLFRLTGQEVPYSVAVEIEKFEQEGNLRRIFAVIIVDRESLKPMIIGNKGERLKEISKSARLDMEKLFGGKVWLETWVKVKTGWADDVRALKSLGL